MQSIGKKGFTLIEVMIIVAIIATLVAIAVPSYQGYITKARNQDALLDLRTLDHDIAFYATMTGNLPDDLSQIDTDILNDKWGNPYRYLKVEGAKIGKLRKDRNLVPVNSDYDLYSIGKDGKTAAPFTAKASQDDVVRANDGEFVGLVADY